MGLPKLDAFKQKFIGEVILPSDELYGQLSSTFMGKGQPAVIVEPHSAEDAAAAVMYAQENSLTLSVRSGGHSAAGFSTNNGGIVINLSNLNKVELLDKDRRLVRVGAGGRWGDVALFLKEYGLAISSGDTTTVGVGGLTLGGGIGWMVRKYGLAIDSLAAAEVVTADGKIIRTSETENPDLFWATRGGCGNFGIVTNFEFLTHEVSKVYSGTITYTTDNLPRLLKGLRDCMNTADEALTVILNIMPSFGENPPAAHVTCCYAGQDEAAAMESIEPLKSLGNMVKEDIKEKYYAEVLEEAHPPQGMKIIVRNMFVKSLSDEVIEAIEATRRQVNNFILQIRMLGGAMARVPAQATAFAHRDSKALLLSPVFLPLNATESQTEQALKPWQNIAAFGSGSYANFLSTATEENISTIYPKETYERLVKIKRAYDPENIFNQNYNIKP